MSHDPFLDTGPIPDFPAMTPEAVRPAFDQLIATARAALGAIRTDTRATYESTLHALEEATRPVARAYGFVSFLRNVVHSQAWVDAHAAVTPDVVGLFSAIPLDGALHEAVQRFAATEAAQSLSPTRRRQLDKTLDMFRRNGASAPPAVKERLTSLRTELAEVTNRFGVNVLEASSRWSLLVGEDRLEGLPESTREMLMASAREAGEEGYRVTLQAPIVTAILEHAADRELRKTVWLAYAARATASDVDNRPLVAQILAMRGELAELLGYSDFADFVLEDRMAGTGARAASFLADLEGAARAAFEEENEVLRAWAAERFPGQPLEPWDVAYHARSLREATCAFDNEALRPYLPVDAVLRGAFELAETLYGVTISPEPLPVWHEDVKSFKIVDARGEVRGFFYTDLHPRASKRAGAWMTPMLTGGPRDDDWVPHVGAICANLTPPVADTPALLTHREVETVFHEFGHLVHHLLSVVEVPSLSGTSVAWDFVELPSQIMENWCWEREALDAFAAHHVTGARIPDALYEGLIASRTFRAASRLMRQLSFGTLDLMLHRGYDPERDGEVMAFIHRARQRFAVTPIPDEDAMFASFGHLFSSSTGYAAGYYSYQWAEVLDADAFSRFREEGLHDPEVGRAFLENILEKGDSEDPARLFRQFMGRDPDPAAHLRRYGLVA